MSQRWQRINEQNASLTVGIVRQAGGVLKFLGPEAWETFCHSNVSDKDNVMSIHCFVKTTNHSIYRNSYQLRDKAGRVATSTNAYVYDISQRDEDGVAILQERHCKFSESRATSMKNIMDLATYTVVKYIESMLNSKILSISIDYVVDTKSQLWMLWTSEVKFVRVPQLSDIMLPGFMSGDKTGRMVWAGPKYFEGELDRRFELERDQESTRPSASVKLDSPSHSSSRKTRPSRRTMTEDNPELLLAASHVQQASDSIEKSFETNKSSKRAQYLDSGLPMVVVPLNAEEPSQFPQAFKCKGRFCNLKVTPGGYMFPSKDGEVSDHIAEKLFSRQEMEVLRKDKRFAHMMSFGTPGPALAAISARSIALAERDRRGIATSSKDEPWMHYPVSPRTGPHGPGQHTPAVTDSTTTYNPNQSAASVSIFADDSMTMSAGGDSYQANASRDSRTYRGEPVVDPDEVQHRDKLHREAFTKGMATYYDQVRVCGNCNMIYMLLDWARDILGTGDAHGAGLERLQNDQSNSGAGKKKPKRVRKVQSEADLYEPDLLDTEPSLDVSLLSSTDGYSADKHRQAGRSKSITVGRSASGPPSPIQSRTHLEPISTNSSNPSKGKRNQLSREKPDPAHKTTWKDYVDKPTTEGKAPKFNTTQFSDLDEYLREGSKALTTKKKKEKDASIRSKMRDMKREASSMDSDTNALLDIDPIANLYRGKVLLAMAPGDDAIAVRMKLEENYFDVKCVFDGRQAINTVSLNEGEFDCLLVQRDIGLADAFEVVKCVRESEVVYRNNAARSAAEAGSGAVPYTKRIVTICVTTQTSPADLKKYMKADMDGCLSLPPDNQSLVNTVRAAIPHHLAEIRDPKTLKVESTAKTYHLGGMGMIEGSKDSSTKASAMLAVAAGSSGEDTSISGVVQIDADTRVPYTVIDFARSAVSKRFNKPGESQVFNLIVCHDLFDTLEKMKIFLRPIAEKYLGMQILLWNYPGQAFTEWRNEQLLNNEYLTTCLNEVLGQVGANGTNDFDTNRPFYMMGFGNGTSICSFYACHYAVPNLRGLINVNGWSYADSYVAGVMHDCINIFQCAPSSRPDLPVYFFSRFLFSKEYLVKVSVPLALNLYTAVHNPITLKGRISLCKGVLKTVDLRSLLKEIDCPVICLQSTQDVFARPLHTEPFVMQRGGEAKSIFRALQDPRKTCVIWFKSGHEIFQECKKNVQTLLEQILTGFHESHDISFPPAPVVDKAGVDQGMVVAKTPANENSYNRTVEDKFIDNILNNVKRLQSPTRSPSRGAGSASSLSFRAPNGSTHRVEVSREPEKSNSDQIVSYDPSASVQDVVFSSSDPEAWEEYAKAISETRRQAAKGIVTQKRRNKSTSSGVVGQQGSTVLDPTTTAFANQDRIGGKSVSSLDPNAGEFPEIKEYMSWRVKRNKKRLHRLQDAARTIQGAFRSFIARQFIKGIRRRKAAMIIQRNYRGFKGRVSFLSQARRMWASMFMQRVWRGYMGRMKAYLRRLKLAAVCSIQRMYRGHLGRVRVAKIRARRNAAARRIQSLYRRNAARKEAWRRRLQRFAATIIQRLFRGNVGRRRANAERDKYIFSKSQSQGIEFGRQMLLEHKLHATRLQSDVTLLTQEKIESEEKVEALLEEITSFEEGVRVLEKEMHQLSKVEAESLAYMDEESKAELREHKLKLDREFGEMLTKIGARKDMLLDLERKLSNVDKSRQAKEEELRTLERKLVVLLEEQQNELKAIKRKQDVRGAMLAASHEEIIGATKGDNQLVPAGDGTVVSGGSSVATGARGGGGGGPSLQEKRQAAQLMQSTETLMKFGFMSMSMTYFSSLNMVKALRTVSAQDTVMAALSDVQSQRAVGFGKDVTGADIKEIGAMLGKDSKHAPRLKAGQLPGQEGLNVSAWSVEDVSRWLQTLALGQYSETFIDAAVDGEFLYDLNDDDLKNTLGVEHKLHRKKILNCVQRMKVAEAQRESRVNNLVTQATTRAGVGGGDDMSVTTYGNAIGGGDGALQITDGGDSVPGGHGPKVSLPELISLTRHSKFNYLKDALDYLPDKPFDKALVKVRHHFLFMSKILVIRAVERFRTLKTRALYTLMDTKISHSM